jgi:hypothetical protein
MQWVFFAYDLNQYTGGRPAAKARLFGEFSACLSFRKGGYMSNNSKHPVPSEQISSTATVRISLDGAHANLVAACTASLPGL